MNKAIVSTIAALLAQSAFLAPDAHGVETLPPVVIRASPHLTGGALPSAGQNASDYEEADLAIAHERTVDEVLRGTPGVTVTKAGAFGVGSILSRGLGGEGLITLDGIPIPGAIPGAVNLGSMFPDGLQEIIHRRGFSSAAQPFSSLGGRIELVSRSAKENTAGLTTEGGTYGFLKDGFRGDVKGEHGGIALTAIRADTFDGAYHAERAQGNTERDKMRTTNLLAKAGIDWDSLLGWEGSL